MYLDLKGLLIANLFSRALKSTFSFKIFWFVVLVMLFVATKCFEVAQRLPQKQASLSALPK
jgi:hypothetical protein